MLANVVRGQVRQRSTWPRFRRLTFALICCGMCAAGCGQRQQPNRLSVYPVSGQLRVDGQPAAGAEIYFQPSSPIVGLSIRPMAKVAADGSFAAGTYLEQDGLPAGRYLLTVSWPKTSVVEGEQVSGPDQLGGRFSNPARPVAEAVIAEGPNTIEPLDLKTR